MSRPRKSETQAKRKEVWEERQKLTLDQELGGTSCSTQVDARGQKKTPQQEEGFAANTAKATGKSKKDINRSVKRATKRSRCQYSTRPRVRISPAGV